MLLKTLVRFQKKSLAEVDVALEYAYYILF